jgi:hypothetical protein
MKQHLNIKGKNLWKLCALGIMAIVIYCCDIAVTKIDQPTTAIAGTTIAITLHDSVTTNIATPPACACVNANYVMAFLAPKGWAAAQGATVSYTSSLGSGNMKLMPANILEPSTVNAGTNLTWVASLTQKFGIGKNLVKDVEWVVYESNEIYTIGNTITILGTINIKLPVGGDGNNTSYFPAYVTCDSYDGLNYYTTTPDFSYNNGACLVQTGTNGALQDYCNPQLTSIDPPKSLSTEFITLSYNNKLDTAGTPLTGLTDLYLCVDTAYTSDGKALTNFCMQTKQTNLVQTTATSGLFKLTIWPQSFFGLSAGVTVNKMVYHITNNDGTKKVGYGGNPNVPFVYLFSCK